MGPPGLRAAGRDLAAGGERLCRPDVAARRRPPGRRSARAAHLRPAMRRLPWSRRARERAGRPLAHPPAGGLRARPVQVQVDPRRPAAHRRGPRPRGNRRASGQRHAVLRRSAHAGRDPRGGEPRQGAIARVLRARAGRDPSPAARPAGCEEPRPGPGSLRRGRMRELPRPGRTAAGAAAGCPGLPGHHPGLDRPLGVRRRQRAGRGLAPAHHALVAQPHAVVRRRHHPGGTLGSRQLRPFDRPPPAVGTGWSARGTGPAPGSPDPRRVPRPRRDVRPLPHHDQPHRHLPRGRGLPGRRHARGGLPPRGLRQPEPHRRPADRPRTMDRGQHRRGSPYWPRPRPGPEPLGHALDVPAPAHGRRCTGRRPVPQDPPRRAQPHPPGAPIRPGGDDRLEAHAPAAGGAPDRAHLYRGQLRQHGRAGLAASPSAGAHHRPVDRRRRRRRRLRPSRAGWAPVAAQLAGVAHRRADAGGPRGSRRSRVGALRTARAPRDPTGPDRPRGDGDDPAPGSDRVGPPRNDRAGHTRPVPLHRGLVRPVPWQRWRRRRQDQLGGLRHALVPQHHTRPRDGDRDLESSRDRARHPQWRDAGRPRPPLARHDLGPRLELGRGGRARPRRLSARNAARPAGRSRQRAPPRRTTARPTRSG